METILVSACLLGVCCRYDGKTCRDADVLAMADKYDLLPICPEVQGGLPTPRDPSERVSDKVLSCHGADVTREFLHGAEYALSQAQKAGCTRAVLKAHSPSCGHGLIYDGSFSGKLTAGNGTTAQLLQQNGIQVLDETELAKL